MANVTI